MLFLKRKKMWYQDGRILRRKDSFLVLDTRSKLKWFGGIQSSRATASRGSALLAARFSAQQRSGASDVLV